MFRSGTTGASTRRIVVGDILTSLMLGDESEDRYSIPSSSIVRCAQARGIGDFQFVHVIPKEPFEFVDIARASDLA